MTAGLDVEDDLASVEDICRGRGIRLTRIRRSIMKHLMIAEQPLSAYDLLSRIRPDGPAAPTLVYRGLRFLLEHGLVHRLETTRTYIACCRPDHAHAAQFLICRLCGNVLEVADRDVMASVETLAQRHGFAVESRIVELRGLCVECRS